MENNTLYLDTFYNFYRTNGSNSSHPFYISDTSAYQTSNKILLSGNGSPSSGITPGQSFLLNFNNLTLSDTLYYYCTIQGHSMVGTFNVLENNEG